MVYLVYMVFMVLHMVIGTTHGIHGIHSTTHGTTHAIHAVPYWPLFNRPLRTKMTFQFLSKGPVKMSLIVGLVKLKDAGQFGSSGVIFSILYVLYLILKLS